MNIVTNPPKGFLDTVEKDARRIKSIIKSRNLRKSDESLITIARDACRKYETWKKRTATMRRRLTAMNELLEGVVEDTNFPFEGASNITIGYAASMARTLKAVFNRTAFQDPDIFSATAKNKSIPKDELTQIEESVNYSFHSESNGLDILKESIIPCYRDGTVIISGYWQRILERCNDSRIYKDAQAFIQDFPTSQDAGIDEGSYGQILDSFLMDNEAEITASFQYDAITYDGPEYEIIPIARFVFYPLHAEAIKKMELYGREYFLSENEIKQKAKRNEFYEKQAEELLKKRGGMEQDAWSASKNFIEGLANSGDKEPFKLVDCVYKADLDKDGIQEKYLLTFSPEFSIVLSFMPYHLRNNIDFCVDFRFLARENRFLGVSILADNQDKFELLDTIHRHRNNIRTLVTSPIILANKRIKEDVDLFRSESILHPGTTFWVDDPNSSMKQLILQNLDQPGNSLDEENLLTRYVELSLGVTQALSGKETPSDPRAPMGKVIALLQQANQRVDDYLDEYRKPLPLLARLHTALLAQFGPEQMQYAIEQNGEVINKEIGREAYLRTGVLWRAKRRSVTLSPEFAMQRLGGLVQLYQGMFQLLQTKDPKAVELWNRMVIASGETGKEALIIKEQPDGQGMMLPAPPAGPAAPSSIQEILAASGKTQAGAGAIGMGM